MGQKTHPFGLRVGITEAHKSRWYAPKALYGELLVEDHRIRTFLDKRLNRSNDRPNAAVSVAEESGFRAPGLPSTVACEALIMVAAPVSARAVPARKARSALPRLRRRCLPRCFMHPP